MGFAAGVEVVCYQIKLLTKMGLLECPRKRADPIQHPVWNKTDLLRFMKNSYARWPIYVSSNPYPEIVKNVPTKIKCNSIYHDFDDEEKVENALLDARKFRDWHVKENLKHFVCFSGSKGFNADRFHNGEVFSDLMGYKRKLTAVHKWLVKTLGLRTFDSRICGDIFRIRRVPLSRYVSINKMNGQPVVGETHCMPMTSEMLDWDLPDIVEASKNLTEIWPEFEGEELGLDEFIARYGIDVDEWAKKGIKDGEVLDDYAYAEIRNGFEGTRREYLEYLKLLVPKPCVWNDLASDNPRHLVRVELVEWLRDVCGMSLREVAEQYAEIAENMGYVDRHRRWVQRYQISKCYTDAKYEIGCDAMREIGVCVAKDGCEWVKKL